MADAPLDLRQQRLAVLVAAFVLLDRSCPTRLLAGLPEGVPVRRLGLSEVVAETRDFLSQP